MQLLRVFHIFVVIKTVKLHEFVFARSTHYTFDNETEIMERESEQLLRYHLTDEGV